MDWSRWWDWKRKRDSPQPLSPCLKSLLLLTSTAAWQHCSVTTMHKLRLHTTDYMNLKMYIMCRIMPETQPACQITLVRRTQPLCVNRRHTDTAVCMSIIPTVLERKKPWEDFMLCKAAWPVIACWLRVRWMVMHPEALCNFCTERLSSLECKTDNYPRLHAEIQPGWSSPIPFVTVLSDVWKALWKQMCGWESDGIVSQISIPTVQHMAGALEAPEKQGLLHTHWIVTC